MHNIKNNKQIQLPLNKCKFLTKVIFYLEQSSLPDEANVLTDIDTKNRYNMYSNHNFSVEFVY